MKLGSTPEPRRQYNQTARALAAEATSNAIVESFLKKLEEQWFEEITLESIARDSGVTVQTIIRRFGGKTGLLEIAITRFAETVHVNRPKGQGNVDSTVDLLAKDYEVTGDFLLRLASQEGRHPVLTTVLDRARSGQREWLSGVFAKELKALTPAKRKAVLDELFVSSSLPIWKLVRRVMGRSLAKYKTMAKKMMKSALQCE